jgi:hypothetical protein
MPKGKLITRKTQLSRLCVDPTIADMVRHAAATDRLSLNKILYGWLRSRNDFDELVKKVQRGRDLALFDVIPIPKEAPPGVDRGLGRHKIVDTAPLLIFLNESQLRENTRKESIIGLFNEIVTKAGFEPIERSEEVDAALEEAYKTAIHVGGGFRRVNFAKWIRRFLRDPERSSNSPTEFLLRLHAYRR